MLNKIHFKKLLKTFGYTMQEVSALSDISIASLTAYEKGTTDIPSTKLATLADTLDCSCDYLIGRIDEPTSDVVKCITAVEKAVIEKKYAGVDVSETCLRQNSSYIRTKTDLYEKAPLAVFPYNLIDTLADIPAGRGAAYDTNAMAELYSGIDIPLSDDQVKGIYAAIGMLSEHEQDVIRKRYIDLMTLDEIASLWHVTRERVRQCEAKALRKLRHPSRFKMIKYGYDNTALLDENEELNQKKAALEKEKKILDAFEEELNTRSRDLRFKAEQLGLPPDEIKKVEAGSLKLVTTANAPLENLDLSVRSYNCLKRAGIKTVGELVAHISESGEKWVLIRNLGKKGAAEISEKLKEYTGRSAEEIVRNAEKNKNEKI